MYAFLKTQVVKDDRKYNYLKDGKNYRVFLTLPNTTDNVPHEVRYGGQEPIFIGTFEKDTYETEFGYRLSFKDTWVFHPRYEEENIDVVFTDYNSMYGLVKHRKATGDITYTLKKWTTIAKKAFRVFVESFDDSFAESIRDREEPVVNPITKEYCVPYDTSYNKPGKTTYIRITNDVNIIQNIYGQRTAERVAGKVFMVDQWCVNSTTLHHRPQNDVNAVVTREELNRVISDYTFSAGVSFYPRMFEVVKPKHDDPKPEHDEMWHSIGYTISFDSFEFNPNAESNEDFYDMDCLELLQDGLMKALLDLQRRISQQAMDDVKEASE